jgi:hypothetical protein
VTKIVIPKPRKYDIEVAEIRHALDFKDGYMYEDRARRGHWVVTLYKFKDDGGSIRITDYWDSKRMAVRQAKALRKNYDLKLLDHKWATGAPINPFFKA